MENLGTLYSVRVVYYPEHGGTYEEWVTILAQDADDARGTAVQLFEPSTQPITTAVVWLKPE
jgi:hypothetical protein